MILYCVFYERLSTDSLEFMDAIDEYTLDENRGWLDDKVGIVGEWKRHDRDIGQVKVIAVEVSDKDIADAFKARPVIGQVRK